MWTYVQGLSLMIVRVSVKESSGILHKEIEKNVAKCFSIPKLPVG